MNILQVVSAFPPTYAFGGPSRVAYQIARALVKRKHEVTVYTSDAKDPTSRLKIDPVEVVDGIVTHYFRNLTLALVRRSNLFVTPTLIGVARKEIKTFDIVHLHEYRSFQNAVISHYARKYDIPFILQAHGTLPSNSRRRTFKQMYDFTFGNRMLEGASKVLALSRAEVQQYLDAGVREDKIVIVPNGIDSPEYNRLPSPGSFMRKWNISGNRMILYLGRIDRAKGLDFLINAFHYLIKDMKYAGSVLVIAGTDYGYLDHLKRQLDSMGINDNVVFTGPLSEDEKKSAYVDSSIVVNVEPVNVFGLVPLEAAACARPVIVSDGNAISETVSQGGFGFSVKFGSIEMLAKTMQRMLGDDSERKKMGKEGRRFVLENFNWPPLVNKLEKVYQSLVC